MRSLAAVGEIQRRMREFVTPTWGYRLAKDGEIEKDLFEAAIPPGWAASPADVGKVEVAPEAPDGAVHGETGGESGEPFHDPGAAIERPYEDHKRKVLSDELKRRTGKGARPGTTVADIAEALYSLDGDGQTMEAT